MSKIIKDDLVVVIAGQDKGKQGRVRKILGDKVVVEGVALVKRHQKPSAMRGIQGGIVSKERPLSISNVAIVNPSSGKADRVAIKLIDSGDKVKRIRVFKSDGMEVPVAKRD